MTAPTQDRHIIRPTEAEPGDGMEHDLRTPMKPCVIHLAEQGAYEFITADKPVIHRDCGSYTLLLDMDSEEVIGVQWPDGLAEPSPSLVEAAEAMAAALRGYEQWEGDIILNGDWGAAGMAPTPRMTQAQWDQMIELQSKRNTALALYSTTSKEG